MAAGTVMLAPVGIGDGGGEPPLPVVGPQPTLP